jgi:hypothetical protein
MSESNDNKLAKTEGSSRSSQLPFRKLLSLAITLLAGLGAGTISIYHNSAQGQGPQMDGRARKLKSFDDQINANVAKMVDEGRQTFRFDTFGDEAFWGDTLKLHQAIEGSNFGGVGPGVSPAAALNLGLKVDVDALPKGLPRRISRTDTLISMIPPTRSPCSRQTRSSGEGDFRRRQSEINRAILLALPFDSR